ncbi:hypothetical protein C8J57DRAFT_1507952 [Mycena rebaudengoi]|nr:hypothetical protein C8J57DRAFT_1507952 [Mycena rebaudengoi]
MREIDSESSMFAIVMDVFDAPSVAMHRPSLATNLHLRFLGWAPQLRLASMKYNYLHSGLRPTPVSCLRTTTHRTTSTPTTCRTGRETSYNAKVDFSNAVEVNPEPPRWTDPVPVGVLYWQAPEVHREFPFPPYPHKCPFFPRGSYESLKSTCDPSARRIGSSPRHARDSPIRSRERACAVPARVPRVSRLPAEGRVRPKALSETLFIHAPARVRTASDRAAGASPSSRRCRTVGRHDARPSSTKHRCPRFIKFLAAHPQVSISNLSAYPLWAGLLFNLNGFSARAQQAGFPCGLTLVEPTQAIA